MHTSKLCPQWRGCMCGSVTTPLMEVAHVAICANAKLHCKSGDWPYVACM